jgi:hypothetical protein
MNKLSDEQHPELSDETMYGPDERPHRTRFTILRLMMAVAVVAILLAVADGLRGIVLVLAVTFLALFGVRWVLLQDQRTIASLGFWVFAVFANVLYAAACITPNSTYFGILFVGWLFIVMPAIIGHGMSWANGSTHGKSVPKRSGHQAVLLVMLLAVLPVLTLLTNWPLRLAFVITRPGLESLANRVDAGSAVGPVRIGLFQFVGSDVDPITGNVGLIINPVRHRRTGLVRVRPGTPPDPRGPIEGSDLDVPLGGGWRYRQQD